jgi:membrane-bound serine protease (ClpP class)
VIITIMMNIVSKNALIPPRSPFFTRVGLMFLLALSLWGLPIGSGLFAQAIGNAGVFLGLSPLTSETPQDAEGTIPPGDAWIIAIRGDINPSMVSFVRRETRRALRLGAGFIIFEIDTFGGRVDSALQITSFIMSIKEARTVAWVNNNSENMGISWSAGALIAFSCTDIYMAAGTSVGAAAPVTVVSGGTQGAGEKAVAAVRSQMAALAERNGHPVGIALAMVDYDVELWEVLIDGRTRALTITELQRLEREGAKPVRVGMISAPGKLLSLTSGDAHRYGLLAGIADDRETLLASLGAPSIAEESSPRFSDTIISILTAAPVQAILIILGLVMIFLEISTPGVGIPGLVAILAFATVFGSGALLGRVGSLELILFLIGIGLLAVEIFLIPGFGVIGIAGLLIIGISLVLSMQDFILPRFDWEWTLLGRNAVVVCTGILAAITGIAFIALLGPRIRIFDGLTLHTRITGTAGGPVQDDEPPPAVEKKRSRRAKPVPTEPGVAGLAADIAADTAGADQGYASLIGKTGKAGSTLRPSGRAEIEGRLYMVETEGLFIERGVPVKVIRVLGNRIIVEPDINVS